MKEAVIIGGGISGLSTAYRLVHDHGIDTVVLEAEKRTGGKARTEIDNGFITEAGTNGWLDKEPEVGILLGDLNIVDKIQPSDDAATHRFIYRQGRLHELFMHPLKFMTGSALPLSARLRVACEPLIPKKQFDSDETLADFAARRLGKSARDLLIGPMAFGVYAGDPSQMSLQSCFGKVHALEKKYGGLIKGMIALKKEKKRSGEDPSAVQAGPSGRLTSLKGGMQDLVDALSAQLQDRIFKDVEVRAIRRIENGFVVESHGCAPIETKCIVSAAPAWAAANYLASLDADVAAAFAAIPYPHLSVVCLGFNKSEIQHDLNGFGFLVPRGQGLTILGSLWTSTIFPGRAPDGNVLIRTMIGGMIEPQVAEWDDNTMIDTVRRELEVILGISATVPTTLRKVYRHAQAIPQYHVGHNELLMRIAAAEKRHPGFFATGNAIKGIGVVDCIRESKPTADRIVESIRRSQ